MIRRCGDHDFELIWDITNDGAPAYKGIIPSDRWTEPYMSKEQLQHELDAGVVFWGQARRHKANSGEVDPRSAFKNGDETILPYSLELLWHLQVERPGQVNL